MNWLESYLCDALKRNVCTKVGCTTCGAREFRKGLLVEAAKQMRLARLTRLNRVSAVVIAQALAAVNSCAVIPADKFESAVRLILTDIWALLGEPNAERVIGPLLFGSWAGDLLMRMKLHHAAVMEAHKQFEEQNDPARVEARRAEKRRQRQRGHEERLARKRERDATRAKR